MGINKAVFKGVKIAFVIMLVLLIVYGTMQVSFTAYDFGYRVFTESAIDEKPGTYVEVIIDESMDSIDIGNQLYEKGLVRDANLFALQYELSAYVGELVPGSYMLSTAMSPREMMVRMAERNSVEDTESTGE